jgi:hypothetical protein
MTPHAAKTMSILHTPATLGWNDPAATRLVSGTCMGEGFQLGFATEKDVEDWIQEIAHICDGLVFHSI